MKRRKFLKGVGLGVAGAVASVTMKDLWAKAEGCKHINVQRQTLYTPHHTFLVTACLDCGEGHKEELLFGANRAGMTEQCYYAFAHPDLAEDLKSIPTKVESKPERFYHRTNVMPPQGRWS